MRCANEKCDKSPCEPYYIPTSNGGDMVCNEACKTEYEKQRDQFFNVIIESDEAFKKYFFIL